MATKAARSPRWARWAAGDRGTATAGEDGVLSITFYDESTRRYRRRIGEIDGVTLLPNVAYRLNAAGEFVAVQS